MKEKIGIFISRYNQADIETAASKAEESGYNVSHYEDVEKIPSDLNGLIIAGGDGTLRLVFDSLYEEDNPAPILVLRGGTTNAFHHALVDAGAFSTIEEFPDNLDSPQFKQFLPGTLGKELFVVDVGVGTGEPFIGKVNEELRRLFDIGQLRPKAAALASWVRILFEKYRKTPIFNLYTLSPYFGLFKMFPEQNLLGGQITHACVNARSKKEAVLNSFWAFFCLGNGLVRLSRLVLDCEKQESFKLNYPVSQLRNGGDTIQNIMPPIPKGTIIERAKKSVRMTALLTDKSNHYRVY